MIKTEKNLLNHRNIAQSKEVKEKYPTQIGFNFIVTSCNADTAKKFLGVWAPILREMMSIYSIHKSIKVEYLLNKLILNSCVDNSK